MEFKNKIIFITGANRGIGAALVTECLQRGATKIYAAARDTSKLSKNLKIIPVQLDITNEEQLAEAVSLAQDTQILINNAGIASPGSFMTGDLQAFRQDMEVNYFATIKVMRAFTPVLKVNKDARIINIVSIAKFTNFPFIAGYSASKAALYSITQAARIELSAHNIPVHAINPGAIDTDMNKGSTMAMTPPSDVATSILDAVEQEILDVVPDKIGNQMLAAWKESPEKLEQLAKELYFSMK